jgi:hypothetical protein
MNKLTLVGLFSVVALCSCSGAIQPPKQDVVKCELAVVGEELADSGQLIQSVFDLVSGETPADRLKLILEVLGRSAAQVDDAIQRLKECSPIYPAPTPAATK